MRHVKTKKKRVPLELVTEWVEVFCRAPENRYRRGMAGRRIIIEKRHALAEIVISDVVTF